MKLASVYGTVAMACLVVTYGLHRDNGRALDLAHINRAPKTISVADARPNREVVHPWFHEIAERPSSAPSISATIDSSDVEARDETAIRVEPSHLPPFRDVTQIIRPTEVVAP